MPELDYQYDIFLSYQNDEVMASWIPDHLIPFIKTFVGNNMNRPVSIFFDRTGIPAGASWPLSLQNAVVRSRCLVAVWNPLYFSSDWCRRECAIMLHREQQLGMRAGANPDGLVVPINVFDGQFFPPRARSIQYFDLKDYWIAGPAFRESQLYVQFQIRLRVFAEWVADAIRRAPSWQAQWENSTWSDVDTTDLEPPATDNFAFPGLE